MIDKVSYSPSFGINVSAHLIDTAHNHYNYNQLVNKKQSIYKFDKKAQEYSNYGYDDYTLDYRKKLEQGNWQHYLVAFKDGEENKAKVVIKRNTLLRLINKFFEINKGELRQKITSGKNY